MEKEGEGGGLGVGNGKGIWKGRGNGRGCGSHLRPSGREGSSLAPLILNHKIDKHYEKNAKAASS